MTHERTIIDAKRVLPNYGLHTLARCGSVGVGIQLLTGTIVNAATCSVLWYRRKLTVRTMALLGRLVLLLEPLVIVYGKAFFWYLAIQKYQV